MSPTGWNAVFKPWRVEPVCGWDDLGWPLIVNAANGKQISAYDLEDHEFCNLEPADPSFIGVLPGNGWTIQWADGETEKVMGFAVQANGRALPILPQHGGHGDPYYAEPTEPAARLVPPRGPAS
ncbi:hypothetical protein [Streptomyces sp. NPDC002994]|uniref:hypothetical protein n=1 Tax=Streptomyces sp. NPDC002994 TaxID=3154441 RepID=UPI0033A9E769